MPSSTFLEYYAFDDDVLLKGFGIKRVGSLLKPRQVDGDTYQAGDKFIIQEIEKRILTQKQSKALHSSFVTLRKLKEHRNVLHLVEVFEDDNTLVIVREFCGGLSLIDTMAQDGPFSEKEAAGIVMQIMSVVETMNKEGLAHRALTPDTIMLSENASGETLIKIEDFQASGPIADALDMGCFLLTANAPPHCTAPEVLTAEGPFTEKVDWWSVGVITYTLLYGNFPFDDVHDAVVIQNILSANYSFPDDITVSSEAKDFITKLLQMEVADRATGSDCWDHPWLRSVFPE